VTVTNGGSGYTSQPTVTFVGNLLTGTGGTALAGTTAATGTPFLSVASVTIPAGSGGSGYTGTSFPVTFDNTNTNGTGAAGTANVSGGVVTSVTITNAGS